MRNCSLLIQSAPRQRTARWSIARWAAACLTAVLLFSAAEALASCGDYVHIAGEMGSGDALSHDEYRLIATKQFQHASPYDPIMPAPLTPSCQGPNCRRQIPQPNPPVPPVAPAGAHHWAYWLSTTEPPDGGLASLSLERSFPPLAGHRRAIDRPPRWGA